MCESAAAQSLAQHLRKFGRGSAAAQAVALAKYQVLAVYSAAGASWFKFESAAERLAWETAINERLLATEGKESQEEKHLHGN